ncbi:MAG: hypothetical protein HYX59_11330 [Elusimicrobia bacterium]|nr:hypothetical protein [Elusimicrobiota bacterium]
MDIKSILAPGEDSLPTLEQNLSTGTVAGPSLPTITADPMTYAKLGGSTVMGLAGMFYLGYGRRHNDARKMVIGAALTIGSILFF